MSWRSVISVVAMVISVVVGSRSAPKLEAAKQGFARLTAIGVEVIGVAWIWNRGRSWVCRCCLVALLVYYV